MGSFVLVSEKYLLQQGLHFSGICDTIHFSKSFRWVQIEALSGAMIEGRTSRLTWGGNLALRLKDLIEKLKLNVGIILYRTVSNHNMHITFVHTTDFERSCSLSSPTVKLVIFPFISLVSIFCT